MDPFELLRMAKAIEAEMGRRGGVRWGPRLIDIDLLHYDQVEIRTEDLVLPHPEMWNRRFVLVPLLEVLPPGELRSRVSERLEALADAQLVRPYEPGL
jgi:2-amino-4-hydroxy-6-hydroxymethyldihydropteridine diphosphokinase